jgi:hypothetical protein
VRNNKKKHVLNTNRSSLAMVIVIDRTVAPPETVLHVNVRCHPARTVRHHITRLSSKRTHWTMRDRACARSSGTTITRTARTAALSHGIPCDSAFHKVGPGCARVHPSIWTITGECMIPRDLCKLPSWPRRLLVLLRWWLLLRVMSVLLMLRYCHILNWV